MDGAPDREGRGAMGMGFASEGQTQSHNPDRDRGFLATREVTPNL